MSGVQIGTAGAVELLGSDVLEAPAANLSFAEIAQSFNHLRLVALLRSDRASETDVPVIQFNGDNGAHYEFDLSSDIGGTVAKTLLNNTTSVVQSNLSIPAANAAAAMAGLVIVDIPAYSLATFNKIVQVSGGYSDQVTNAGDVNWVSGLSVWRSSAAIVSIAIAPQIGAHWAAGSAAYLYGVE